MAFNALNAVTQAQMNYLARKQPPAELLCAFTVVMGAEIQTKVDELWDALRSLAAQKVGA